MDCGDNSCVFALDRGGMRTNGGCRCLKDYDIPTALRHQLHAYALDVRRRVAAAEDPIRQDERRRIAARLRYIASYEAKRTAKVLTDVAHELAPQREGGE